MKLQFLSPCFWHLAGSDYTLWSPMISRGDTRPRKMRPFPVFITSKGIIVSVLAAGWWIYMAESWAVSSTSGFSGAGFVERGTVTRGGQGHAHERTNSDRLPGALGTWNRSGTRVPSARSSVCVHVTLCLMARICLLLLETCRSSWSGAVCVIRLFACWLLCHHC